MNHAKKRPGRCVGCGGRGELFPHFVGRVCGGCRAKAAGAGFVARPPEKQPRGFGKAAGGYHGRKPRPAPTNPKEG